MTEVDKKFYTVEQAAKLLSVQKKSEINESDIVEWAMDCDSEGDPILPIYFMVDDYLSVATICTPDGVSEPIESSFKIHGMVECLSFSGDSSVLIATAVRIYKLISRPLIQGHRLPLTGQNSGHIEAGHTVEGYLHYIEIPQSDWRFIFDDLQKLVGSEEPIIEVVAAAPPAVTPAAKIEALTIAAPAQDESGLSKRERQIRAIESESDTLGYARLRIATGCKTILRNTCKAKYSSLFGAGDSPFDDAWKAASNSTPPRLRMADHSNFAGK